MKPPDNLGHKDNSGPGERTTGFRVEGEDPGEDFTIFWELCYLDSGGLKYDLSGELGDEDINQSDS